MTLVAGDPNQAVFGFRGGDASGLSPASGRGPQADDSPSVTLTVSHRCAPAVARAVSGIARRLPGGSAGRRIDGSGAEDGSVRVRLAASAHAEASMIADAMRRAHLIDGVPWSQMAVIVRSVPRAGARLPRALAAAGVPVAAPSSGGALSDEPAARALLTVLAATADGLNGEQALALSKSLGELWARGFALNYLGQATWLAGDRPRGEALAREAAACQHALDEHRYAPRPARLPVESTAAWPSVVRTMRTSWRLASV